MKQFRLIIILTILVVPVFNLKAADIVINRLQTEYSQTPLGIDVKDPRFSWQMESEKPGCYQTAYQILVFNDINIEVWNSGKISNSESLNVRYNGENLKPVTKYKWQLTVWDNQKKKHVAESWFETGLLDNSESAWNGAKWIGRSNKDLVLYSQYLPVFKIDFTVQLDKRSNSTKAGFIYGANDERLMDKNKNITTNREKIKGWFNRAILSFS